MKTNYEIDSLPQAEIQKIQEGLFLDTVQRVFEKSPYYRRLYSSLGLSPSDIRGLEDLAKLPFLSREEIGRENWDLLAIDRDDISELVSTSGTTGEPVFVAMSSNDLRRLAYNEEKSFTCAGAVKSDLFLIDVTCDNLFIAGIAYYSGLIRLGASVVRVGPQNIARQFDLIRKLRPQGIVAVPSFIARMILLAEEQGFNIGEFGLEKMVLIGDSVRNDDLSLNPLGTLISDAFGNIFYSTYGITEGQISFCECLHRQGLHGHSDLVLTEIIDDNGNLLPDGELGELTLTTLQVEGMPLVRYKTGDVTFRISTPCPCGSNSVRIGPISGRKYHRLKFKGVTLYPKTIENAVLEIGDVVNYQIEATTGGDHTDHILLRVGSFRRDEAFKKILMERLRARARVSPRIEIMQPDELTQRLFADGSRKAKVFLDRRTERK